jgi:PAS domain S-box-containing protein
MFKENKIIREDFESLINTSLDGFFVLKNNGDFVDVNESYCSIIGYTKIELLSMNIRDIEGTESKEETDSHMEKIQTEKYDCFKTKHRCRDGVLVDFEVSVKSLEDSRGIMIVFLRDITEDIRIKEELEYSNRELEDFAYVASHDLQSPLRIISNFADLFIADYNDLLDDEGKHYINHIKESSSEMQILIRDLLRLCRVGERENYFECVNINEIIRCDIDSFSDIIKETNGVVKYDDLPNDVVAQKVRIKQLFHNLISNAFKFRSGKPPVIEITVKDRPAHYLFAVKDNGMGIPEDQLKNIFKPFKKLYGKNEYRGTGIGLAICKKIIETYGGEIWVESSIDSGSTFIFTLPKRCQINK